MLSQTSLYALQALAYMMAHRDSEPILSREIGESTGIPSNYLSKMMHALGASGLLSAERGKKGGYRFARDPNTVPVIDVVNIFQNTEQFRKCVLGNDTCSDESPCHIHERWKPASVALFAFLEQTTIGNIRPDEVNRQSIATASGMGACT
jgi:Rrf2 family transcriptional regulator, iron-sulfur cluster assembly transcription factor